MWNCLKLPEYDMTTNISPLHIQVFAEPQLVGIALWSRPPEHGLGLRGNPSGQGYVSLLLDVLEAALSGKKR